MHNHLGFTWVELIIVLLIIVLLIVFPEWYARDKTKKICQSIQIGGNLEEIKKNSLFYGGLNFGCGFDEKTQSGALVRLVGGWFPFGRDFCVVTVQHSVIISKHTVFGNIDYECDSCINNMRPLIEIEQNCQSAR